MAQNKRFTGKIAALFSAAVLMIGALTVGSGLMVSPAAAADQTVWSLDFEDGTYAPWIQDGGPTLSVVADPDGGSQVLSVANRGHDYDGIQSPTGVLEVGKTYTLSMRVRLASGTEGTTQVRFVSRVNYAWIANTPGVGANGWTTVSGTYTVPGTDNNGNAVDPSAVFIYIGTDNISGLDSYGYLVDDIQITTPASPAEVAPGISTGFEDGLSGWVPRAGSSTTMPTVAVDTAYHHSGNQAACVTGRANSGDGIGYVTDDDLTTGATYNLTAYVRFADGQSTDGGLTLSLASTTNGATQYSTVTRITPVANDGWTLVQANSISMPRADSNMLYFETDYAGGNGTNFSEFCVDDISIEPPTTAPDLTVTPIKDTTDFPVGVAVSAPQIVGQAADLLAYHFNQVTPENAMKEDQWYDANGTFQMSPVGEQIMQFAQDNDIRVYGHNLVWYEGTNNSTPAWFFNVSPTDPTPLTSLPADQAKAILDKRLHDHIFGIAEVLSDEFGLFGSDTNKLTAFDVVNEAIAETASPDTGGLRDSQWYKILGPDFINLAFQYADEAFNTPPAEGGYADPSVVRPVKLFINDYGTEGADKRQRLHDLVERLVNDGVPIDGVGNQLHLNTGMTTPISSVQAALNGFADLTTVDGSKMLVAVTELDAPTGVPVTQSLLTDQGYYYRDLFNVFRQFAADNPGQLYSVTMWGLDDAQSWAKAKGAPLPFDENLQVKPAYYGIVNGPLPTRQMSSIVFGTDATTGDLSATPAGVASSEWAKLPLKEIGVDASFETRWSPDTLYVYVRVDDPAADAGDSVTFQIGDTSYVVNRDGATTGDFTAAVVEDEGGYTLVANLPLDNAKQDDTLDFDLRVDTVQSDTIGWNSPGVLGTLSLKEPLSFVGIPEALTVPTIDGSADDAAWADAAIVTTGISSPQYPNPSAATAQVRLTWSDDTLYVLMHVTDPTIDVSSGNTYEQDSVEIYVDRGNQKSTTYTATDTQMRISAEDNLSFGTQGAQPDQDTQISWLASKTGTVDDGYIVEAAISLDGLGGLGTFQGLDFQVNDGTAGHRTAIRNWADPTDLGYQSPSHWGVGLLLPAVTNPGPSEPVPSPSEPAPGEPPAASVSTGGATSGPGTAMILLAGLLLLTGLGVVAKRRRS